MSAPPILDFSREQPDAGPFSFALTLIQHSMATMQLQKQNSYSK